MNKIFYGLIVASILLCSCQSKQERAAQAAIDRYIIFVDSVNKAKFDKRKERWNFIEEEHLRKKNDAEQALKSLKPKDVGIQRKRINKRDATYNGIRSSVEK